MPQFYFINGKDPQAICYLLLIVSDMDDWRTADIIRQNHVEYDYMALLCRGVPQYSGPVKFMWYNFDGQNLIDTSGDSNRMFVDSRGSHTASISPFFTSSSSSSSSSSSFTAVRLQRLSWPFLPKPQQLTAASCLCCPRNVFTGGVLVSRVRIKHTVYTNVIGQLLI